MGWVGLGVAPSALKVDEEIVTAIVAVSSPHCGGHGFGWKIKLPAPVSRPMREVKMIYLPVYAPNLSNIFALACISRMRNFAGNTLSEPEFAPVSVKRSSLSEPLVAEFSNSGCGCQE